MALPCCHSALQEVEQLDGLGWGFGVVVWKLKNLTFYVGWWWWGLDVKGWMLYVRTWCCCLQLWFAVENLDVLCWGFAV